MSPGEEMAEAFARFANRCKYDADLDLTPWQRVIGLWGTEVDEDLQVISGTKQKIQNQRGFTRSAIPLHTREQIEAAHRFECLYCGDSSGRLVIDHIHPIAAGGSSEPENLAPACHPCNRSKWKWPLWQWLAMNSAISEAEIRQRWERARGDLPLPGVCP